RRQELRAALIALEGERPREGHRSFGNGVRKRQDLEILCKRTGDVQRSLPHETETRIERGVAKQDDAFRARLSPVSLTSFHERAANALALPIRQDGNRA